MSFLIEHDTGHDYYYDDDGYEHHPQEGLEAGPGGGVVHVFSRSVEGGRRGRYLGAIVHVTLLVIHKNNQLQR